jgi:DNA-damage-inducible protein J
MKARSRKKTATASARTAPEGGTKGSFVRARMSLELKVRAENVLAHIGLSSSEAIRLYYAQIALHGGLPFPLKIPNAETRRAMRDCDAGENLTRYNDTAEMFEDLGL